MPMLKIEIENILKQNKISDYRFEAKELYNAFKGEDLKSAINRRINGEPLQYILGEWEFYSLPFFVGEGVLIPRADTETLVDLALKEIKPNDRVIDLCSGSGAIAISLAKNSAAKVYALEKYEKALKYLEKNVALNNADVTVICEDIFKFNPQEKFDIIVSNPPYIKSNELSYLQKEVQFEPKTALDGGPDGLIFYRHIATFIKHLNVGGKIMVEVGFDQAQEVAEIFKNAGLTVSIHNDLNGVQRVIIGTLLG